MTVLLSVMAIGVTGTAYGLGEFSDWRTACDILNPWDNLECSVDHIEGSLNTVEARIVILESVTVVNGTDGEQGIQGVQGIQGILGEQGIEGPQGLALVFPDQYVTERQVTVSAGSVLNTAQNCNIGSVATSAGYTITTNNNLPNMLDVYRAGVIGPNGASDAGHYTFYNPTANGIVVELSVTCLDVDP